MKCISDIYTKEGLLEEKSGVLINKKGIFNINSNETDNRIKMIYMNFANRLGVETTGIQQPLIGRNCLNSITFEINYKIDDNRFIIKIEHGLKIKANSINNLEKAAEYMICIFPYINKNVTLDNLKQYIMKNNNDVVHITEMVISLPSFNIESIEADLNENKKLRIDEQYLLQFIDKTKDLLNDKKIYPEIKKYYKQSLYKNIVLDENFKGDIEDLLLLAYRISLDNFETCYPICRNRLLPDKNNLILKYLSNNEGFIESENNNIIFSGGICAISNNIRNYVHKYDELKNLYNNNILLSIKDILNSKNDIGQIVEFLVQTNNKNLRPKEVITKNCSLSILDESKLKKYIYENINDSITLKKYNDEKEVFKIGCNYKWEGNDFIDCFIKEVVPHISKGDKIELSGILSEDLDVRCDIEKRIKEIVENNGGICTHAKIYRSLKSGVSWIEENVLPDISSKIKSEDINKIVIKFKYFTNEFNDEIFESESTPNYEKHMDKPYKWFDLPTRWLQELFPVDEIIGSRLNISRDDIIFERMDDCSQTYCFEVMDKDNKIIYTNSYNVKYVQKNYMNRYPQIGKVHVTTGWIMVKKNELIILDKRIVTDTEKVWQFIEEQMLPRLESYFSDKYGIENLVKIQPLFNKLQIKIWMSEVDYDIGIRQERLSTTESMQEDIYFYILDWFKTYGERECGKELDNIGLIIPEISNCKEADSSVQVVLYDDYSDDTYIIGDGISKKITEDNIEFKPYKIDFNNDNINLYVDVLCENHKNVVNKLNVLHELSKEKIIYFNNSENYNINFKAGDLRTTLVLKTYEYNKNTITECEKQYIIDNEIITYEKYMDILDYYRKYDEVKILPIETTYKGRKIYCIEIIKKNEGILYSHNKLMTNRITCIYNARHHGNEASSMNASFMMLDKLLSDKKCKEKLDRINVIILPCENIDGSEIHCGFQKDNPKWLCHVARYNSAGYEFRKDYLNIDTKYGESKALVKLWEKWLPDVVTDNHGFEGHEFYMQFSGYTSPWYKSFWIPRALYYGYIWFDEMFPHIKEYGEKIQDAVADAINMDKEIRELNECFNERFYKYAEKWFPEMFNTEKHKDVIFYWIDAAKRKRACNFSLEFPKITTIDWTTEVADETASGDYLKLNSRAHLISDMALFDLMYRTEIGYETNLQIDSDSIRYSKIRRRPLK